MGHNGTGVAGLTGWVFLIYYTVVSDCLRFLLIILGRNGSGNDYFWLKTDRLKKYFRPKEAQTGLKLDEPEKNVAKRIFLILFWPKRIDEKKNFAGRNEGIPTLR